MAHKFNPKMKDKLDNPKRRQAMPPKKTLECLLLKEGDDVLDIGCGIGYFSIPAAKIVGRSGRVYAADISQEMLDEVESRKEKENIQNISTLLGEEYDTNIGDEALNYIFLSNVLHEVDDKDLFLDNYLSKLKSGGKFAVIEWKRIETEGGPPIAERLSEEVLERLLSHHDLKVIKKVSLSPTHYGVVGEKPS